MRLIVGTNLYLANGDLTLFLSLILLIFILVGLNKLDYVILLLIILVGVFIFTLLFLSGVLILELLVVLLLLILLLLLLDNFL